MNQQELDATHDYIQMMLSNTLRLVDIEPPAVEAPDDTLHTASGILVAKEKRYFLLSAGHALSSGMWVIETNRHFYPAKVVVLGINKPHVFHTANEDFAWAEIDLRAIAARIKQDPKWDPRWLELPSYQGPLDVIPDPKTFYGFASWKAVKFWPGVNTLEREPHYEVCMSYDGFDDSNGLYRFKLARKHQGHDYYRGCSGAPITGTDMRIVALVSRGLDEENQEFIWGSPLANYANRIGQV
jgi:hypothetical protein